MVQSYPQNIYPVYNYQYLPAPDTIKKKQPNLIGASIGALIGAGIVKGIPSQIATAIILPAMKKNGKIPQSDIDTIHNAAAKTLDESGLKAKGVKIHYLEKLKPLSLDNLFNPQQEEPFIKKILDAMIINPIREGENACFVNKDIVYKENGERKVYLKKNSILMPKKDISGAVFHEMGHAMNFHFSKIGKGLQKLRPIAIYGPIVMGLYGACTTNSKQKNGKELNTRQKTNNFLRKHAGLLALGLSIPMLVEEGMATYKGQKFADKLLSKELAANVLKGNKIAYCSYIASAVISALGAFASVKFKDKIIKN